MLGLSKMRCKKSLVELRMKSCFCHRYYFSQIQFPLKWHFSKSSILLTWPITFAFVHLWYPTQWIGSLSELVILQLTRRSEQTIWYHFGFVHTWLWSIDHTPIGVDFIRVDGLWQQVLEEKRVPLVHRIMPGLPIFLFCWKFQSQRRREVTSLVCTD